MIVDHNLRPESEAESEAAVAIARAVGLAPHVTRLNWTLGTPARKDLLAAARRARYRELLSACRRLGVPALLTAHHAGDCFLPLLAKSSSH